MSKIKNDRLDQYGAELFEQQQFGTAGVSGGLTTKQWRHEPPAPNFWAKKSAPHSDSVQILEVINLYNRTAWPSTKVVLHV